MQYRKEEYHEHYQAESREKDRSHREGGHSDNSAVVVVAGAVAYICLKLADEMRYNEKWKDYDECGLH